MTFHFNSSLSFICFSEKSSIERDSILIPHSTMIRVVLSYPGFSVDFRITIQEPQTHLQFPNNADLGIELES